MKPSALGAVGARAEAFRAAGLWDDQTLAGRVADHAASRPDAVAVVDGTGRHTYGELAADAAALAAWLRANGVSPGDVVSVQLPNRYEAVVSAVAVLSIPGVLNPLLPNYRAKELGHVFTTAKPAAIITPDAYNGFDHVALVEEVVAATGHRPVHLVVGGNFAEARADGELGRGVATEVSELIFTSGTEATPKAIMHTEETAGFSVRVAYDDMGLTPDDVVWMPSPVGHSTGFNYGVRFGLHHGLKLVLQDKWDGDHAAALIQAEGCSYTLAATTFLQDLVGAADRAGVKLSSMRCFGCGGAPVPAELVRAAAERGIGVLRLYGSTEVLVGTWNRVDSPDDKKANTDGRPMSHVEVRTDDDGELFTRGPNCCVGFFDDPERTAATFDAEGWVRSGDLVALDDDGYLTVVGRKKEIIIRGGMNIAPREIEELLVAFPEVQRAAVIGLPDERLGERMCACVVLEAGTSLDLATVVERLEAGGLAKFKLPQRLEVLDALPTTASGKVQKHEIVRALTS
jgi:non-ribosomal peptide synthetase component E (peptide arylation enzyme)